MCTSKITVFCRNGGDITIREETTTERFRVEIDLGLLSPEGATQDEPEGREEGCDELTYLSISATMGYYNNNDSRGYSHDEEVVREFDQFVKSKEPLIFREITSVMKGKNIYVALQKTMKRINDEVFMPKLWLLVQAGRTVERDYFKGFEIRPVFHIDIRLGYKDTGARKLYFSYRPEDGIILGNNWGRDNQGLRQLQG